MPCFVASYIDLCKVDSASLSADAKDLYGLFISNILEDYSETAALNCGSFRSNCYLKWKFDSVASELEFLLYGRASGSPKIVRQLQEKCFDVLTDPLGRVDEIACKVPIWQWKVMLYNFSDRMQYSLLNITGMPVELSENRVDKDIEYALSTLCRNIAEDVFKHRGFKDKEEFSDSRLLLSAIFTAHAKSDKIKIVKLRGSASKCKTWSDVQTVIETESDKLSEQQRFGLALYLCLSSNDMAACVSRYLKSRAYLYPCKDWMEMLILQILWGFFGAAAEKIPVLLSPSLSQVSLEFAQETAPTCYSPVFNRVVNGKVTMDTPGQNTFCPVPHCRWCGLVQDPSMMRECLYCSDSPKYPDTHLFCSSECEDQAMKHQHSKRHEEFLEYKLGLETVSPVFSKVPLESPNYIMFKTSLIE